MLDLSLHAGQPEVEMRRTTKLETQGASALPAAGALGAQKVPSKRTLRDWSLVCPTSWSLECPAHEVYSSGSWGLRT